MFYNKINGHTYIGSAINLTRRFNSHLFHINKSPLPLYRAIRKYSLNNFIFCIFQYCDPDYTVCLKLEQQFLDLYQPYYNILKIAGSSLGSKHKPETIKKLQKLHKGELHPRFGAVPGPVLRRRALTSLRLKKFYAENIHHNKGKKGILVLRCYATLHNMVKVELLFIVMLQMVIIYIFLRLMQQKNILKFSLAHY